MNEPSEVPTVPSGIQWPDGIDEAVFLQDYWQKKPLLIRQAFPAFQTPLDANELAGLSLEPETTPRIITRDNSGDYHLEHGPFEENRFTTLNGNNWSLLVTDVELTSMNMMCSCCKLVASGNGPLINVKT